jgi:hypothetical protein
MSTKVKKMCLDCERAAESKKKYPIEVEAAWFALRQFVDYCFVLSDYSYKKCFFSKKMLEAHLNDEVTLYYRTKKYSPKSVGFGVSNKQACNQPYSDLLNVKTKCIKAENESVMLIAFETNVHNSEEAAKCKDVLLKYFPESYCEIDEINITVYVKIVYDTVFNSTKDVLSILKQLEPQLNVPLLGGGSDQRKIVLLSTPDLHDMSTLTQMAQLPRFAQHESKTQIDQTLLFALAPLHNIDQYIGGLRENISYTSQYSDTVDNSMYTCSKASLNNRSIQDYSKHNNDVYPVSEFEKQLGYYQKLSRDYGYVPAPSEALALYMLDGFLIAETKDPLAQFEYLEKLVSKTFNPKKFFSFCGFERQKARICKFLDSRLQLSSLACKKEKVAYKKGKETRYIKLEEIGAAYFAMLKLQTFKNADCTKFGRKTLQKVLKFYKLNSQPNVASKIFELLEMLGLIRNVANYVPGVRSNVWEVVQISFLPDRAA